MVCDEERYIHTFGFKKNKETGKTEVKLPSFTLLGFGMEVLIADSPTNITEAEIEDALAANKNAP